MPRIPNKTAIKLEAPQQESVPPNVASHPLSQPGEFQGVKKPMSGWPLVGNEGINLLHWYIGDETSLIPY